MTTILFGLASLIPTLVVLSAPFCVLQLALCKFCPWKPVQFIPAVLFGAGFLWGWQYLEQHSNWDALLGIFVLFPSLLGLIGSGAGWLLWYFSQKHLR